MSKFASVLAQGSTSTSPAQLDETAPPAAQAAAHFVRDARVTGSVRAFLGNQASRERFVPYPITDNSYDTYRDGGTTLEISALIRLVLVVRGFRSRLDERLRAINQSAARMETLAAIINMQGQVSQSDLARRLRVEGATITRMIDLLSGDGLVERSPHPTDRRINLLSVTEAGEAALRRIFRVYDLTRAELLKDVSENDIAQLYRITGLMLDRLDSSGGGDIRIDDLPALDRLRDPTAGGSG